MCQWIKSTLQLMDILKVEHFDSYSLHIFSNKTYSQQLLFNEV